MVAAVNLTHEEGKNEPLCAPRNGERSFPPVARTAALCQDYSPHLERKLLRQIRPLNAQVKLYTWRISPRTSTSAQVHFCLDTLCLYQTVNISQEFCKKAGEWHTILKKSAVFLLPASPLSLGTCLESGPAFQAMQQEDQHSVPDSQLVKPRILPREWII